MGVWGGSAPPARPRLIQRVLDDVLDESEAEQSDEDQESAPDGQGVRGATDLYGSLVQRSHAMGDDNE